MQTVRRETFGVCATEHCCGRVACDCARRAGVQQPEVRYVEREGKCLAYEVFGSGPCDVIAFQSCCPIDLIWELPQLASFMEALGQMARVIVWDPRGSGASDPFSDPGAAILEISSDDALAVLDATGSDRATYFDMSAGATGVVFAATYPQRVRSLIVNNLRSSF